MKSHSFIILLAAIASATAQNTTSAQYHGQSWVGLLVPASCDKVTKGQADRSKSVKESDLTVTARTTTPAVDQSGTRGSSTALDPSANPPSEKQVLPATGDVLAKSSSPDPDWSSARKQAHSLGASCSVGPDVKQFSLLMPDGKMVPFDDLANQGILKQMPASSDSKRIYRVWVQGKMQDGKIALVSIRM